MSPPHLHCQERLTMRRFFIMSGILLLGASSAWAGPQTISVLEEHLQAGKLSAAEGVLEAELKLSPRDAQARFGLGAVQFLRSVEGLSQNLYRHGLLQQQRGLLTGWIDLPLPINPKPEKLSYQQSRQIVQDFVSGLTKAEATLAQIGNEDVKLPLHFGLIRMDLNGDGMASEEETLWRVYTKVNQQTRVPAEVAAQFVIGFDTGDVYWLRGYCHLLMGLGEATLAHDWRELFERAGHVIFPEVESPYPFLSDYGKRDANGFSYNRIVDVIAYIHLINFPVIAPERMQLALGHLESMMDVSSRSWDFIEQETDDSNEWIPNPKQQGVIPNVRVTAEMIASWRHFLAEAKEILQGKKLIPFWRGYEARGVNLRLVCTQPKPFDLVMWFQGTGAAPYLQKGELTDPEVWNRMRRVFGGEFIGFALWFN